MTQSDDLDRLMAELRARVAEKKAQGLYSVDALADADVSGPEPLDSEALARLHALADTTPDLGAARSTAPVIGSVVSAVKAGLVRGTQQPLLDLAGRTTAFNAMLLHYVTELSQELMRLRERVHELEDREGHGGAGSREA